MTNTKYKINDIVETEVKGKLKTLTIVDFEIFGELILYYTNDGKAYPQGCLKLAGYKGLSYFLFASDEEKDKDFLEILQKLNMKIS